MSFRQYDEQSRSRAPESSQHGPDHVDELRIALVSLLKLGLDGLPVAQEGAHMLGQGRM
jgi:hypothetical protein